LSQNTFLLSFLHRAIFKQLLDFCSVEKSILSTINTKGMTKLNCYLNFQGNAEEAFNFYKSIFGGEFTFLMRFKDVPDFPDKAKLSEAELNKIMHVSLKVGDSVLMATDLQESLGHHLKTGNGMTLSLEPDRKEEGDRLYNGLSKGGNAQSPMADQFWGYWGMLTDKFGIQWMINVPKSQ
jgi:PhnB protein